jgi:flotillin
MLAVLGLIVISIVTFVASHYKNCPANKILVICGKTGTVNSAKCIHGGGTFVWPLIQTCSVLRLSPLTTDIALKAALSKENIRVNVPSTFTFAISSKPELRLNAAERLLGLADSEIIKLAEDIIFGQLRLVVATLAIEEINQDREKFLELVNLNVNVELNKIGLEIINVNVQDITDESGYIEAIGKKAASEAINKATIEVAEQEKLGAIGRAAEDKQKVVEVAKQDAETQIGTAEAQKIKHVESANLLATQEIGVAEASTKMRIQTATLNAEAVSGENVSKANVAQYNADLTVKEAKAKKMAEVAQAEASEAILNAQALVEKALLTKQEVVQEEINKVKVEVQADATAAQLKKIADGEAYSIKAKYVAEAEGVKALLEAKADGYKNLLSVCGDRPETAATLLMIEKLEDIVRHQTEAIKNLKIDKITVWDSGQGTSTAGFLKQFAGVLPPVQELAKQAGIELPDYLGKISEPVINAGFTPETANKKPINNFYNQGMLGAVQPPDPISKEQLND